MRISDWSSDVCSSDLVDTFAEVSASWLSGVPTATQAIVTDFMNEGLFATHIRLMRRAYKARHDALVEAMAGLSARIALQATSSGFHTVGRSEERRVGQGCVRMFRTRVWPGN